VKASFRLVRTGALLLSRGERAAQRALAVVAQASGGFLAEALTETERAELGAALYDEAHREGPARLFAWERDWFARRLPPPPARLLVGGAGDGREAVALAAMGYRVDAFEPAPRPAAACARRLPAGSLVVTCRYEDLSRAILDGAGGAASVFSRPYAAVLLGWGSLSHVLAPAERARVVETSARLSPEGPTLASFWMRAGAEGSAAGRAEQAGRALGRRIGRWRGAEPAGGLGFGWRYGFGHAFDRAEIEDLAARAGRRVLWEDASGGYPHATLQPVL
jgi:hypothetical protein